jgi:DNA modification methylase
LFGDDESILPESSSTFSDNLKLPVHRWFRYSAGFSAVWVAETIKAAVSSQLGPVRVLDPFAGSGTVLVEAEAVGVASKGVESHPFIARVAKVKTDRGLDAAGFRAYAQAILKRARQIPSSVRHYPPLVRKCYPDEPLGELDQLRTAWLETAGNPYHDHGWLTLAAILRPCSPVGTANWQYVLPKKTKAKVIPPFAAFKAKAAQIYSDMIGRPRGANAAMLVQGDARELQGIPDGWATLVITSPPYPNNFDYADATRLEMTFFGEIAGWGGLQDRVRKHLVRSCTQHVSPLVRQTARMVASLEVAVIRDELKAVCDRLETERANHGGKKNYHTMIAAYFSDMAQVWKQLRRVTTARGRVCFVIGDSAPYGVYVPVDKWMGELATAAGFRSSTFEKTRDRNVKWKNRKHRVPLHEGRLWVEA